MDISLNRQMVVLIRALYFSITEEWSEIVNEHNLSSAQQHLLYVLSSSDQRLSISDISRLGCWHISTVTRLLQPLLKEKYIEINNGKGRTKYVELTEYGRQKLKSIAEDVFQRVEFPLNCSGVSEYDVQQFLKIGYRILANQKGEEFIHWVQESKPNAIFP